MWTGEGAREFRLNIAFRDGGFIDPPLVHVGMTMWDMDQKTNQRVDIAAENISATGFEIVFRTWGDTRVARVRADWIAMGEVLDEEDWSLY